jgi:hypothetical protein
MQSHLFIPSLRCWAFWVLLRKKLPIPSCSSVFPNTYDSCFKISGLILRSLIHFELILVQGRRQGSNYSVLHINVQQFVEEVVFSPLCVLSSFVKNQLAVSVWVFYSNSLVFLFLCQNHAVLIVWLYSIVWNWVSWYLQHWTFYSELLWLLEVFCVPICISRLVILSLWSMSLKFW